MYKKEKQGRREGEEGEVRKEKRKKLDAYFKQYTKINSQYIN